TEERVTRRGVRRGGSATTDRVVEHVDAVDDRLVDAGEDVGGRASVVGDHGGVGSRPADLVGRDLGRGSDTGDLAEVDALDARGVGVVAGRGARGVRAVAVAVTRRDELAGAGRRVADVGRAEAIEVVTRTDELRVAVGGVELLTLLADARE